MEFLSKYTVLVLNSLFYPIGVLSPKKALIALNSSSDQHEIVARAVNVVYRQNSDGSLNTEELDYWEPLSFDKWMLLTPRIGIDEVIHTPRFQLRCPTVIVTNYSKMPMRKFKVSKSVLYQMQKGVCGYTGQKIPMHRGNLEHKLPKSHGGKETFENLMFVKTEINSKRGNKDLKELGLKPLFNHREPHSIPACNTIKKVIHPDWKWFVLR